MRGLKWWSSVEQCAVVELLCTGDARSWFDSQRELEDANHPMFANYDELKKALYKRFYVSTSYSEKVILIENTHQTDPYRRFISRLLCKDSPPDQGLYMDNRQRHHHQEGCESGASPAPFHHGQLQGVEVADSQV